MLFSDAVAWASLSWQRQSHLKANGKWKGTNKTVKTNKKTTSRELYLLPLEISALYSRNFLPSVCVCWLMNKAIIDSIHHRKSFHTQKNKTTTQKLLGFYFILFIKLLLSCSSSIQIFSFKKKNEKINKTKKYLKNPELGFRRELRDDRDRCLHHDGNNCVMLLLHDSSTYK